MLSAILLAIKNSDHSELLEEVYLEYKDKMFRYAYKYLQDEYLAEEAVGETFVGLVRNAKTLSTKHGDDRTRYIIRAVKNSSINVSKKRSYRTDKEVLTDWNDDRDAVTYDQYSLEEDKSEMLKFLECLSEATREVVLLRVVESLSYKEIAKIKGISKSQVGVMLNRAKKQMKKYNKGLRKDEKDQDK